MKKISFNILLKKARVVGLFFWKRLFLLFVLFLVIDILIIAILLVRYYFKPAKSVASPSVSTSFNQGLFNRAVNYWSEGQAVIDAIEQKQYPDLFE